LDIKVGHFGNTFLLSSIIAICFTRPTIIYDFFENITYNYNGIYGVRILIQGELNLILIDDKIPILCDNKKIPMTSYTKKEIWLPILEKAWAKANGKSYIKNLYGTPLEAFKTISFAPTIVHQHKKYNLRGRFDLIWKILLEASLKKYAICVSTEHYENNDLNEFPKEEEKENSSIDNNSNINLHNENIKSVENQMIWNLNCNKFFSILDVYEFEEGKLIKAWTPKDEDISEWNGLYSEDSDEWSKELKEYVGYKKTPGVIYLTFDEYVKIFSWTYICKIKDNYIYQSLTSKSFSPDSSEIEKENKLNNCNKNKEEEICKIFFL